MATAARAMESGNLAPANARLRIELPRYDAFPPMLAPMVLTRLTREPSDKGRKDTSRNLRSKFATIRS